MKVIPETRSTHTFRNIGFYYINSMIFEKQLGNINM